jgi:hypothetical protein
METWVFVLGLVTILFVCVTIYYTAPASQDISGQKHRDISNNPPPIMDVSSNSPPLLLSDNASPMNIWLNEHQKKRDCSGGKVDSVVFLDDRVAKPYEETPINSVDDYEYSLIFRNEGDRAMTKKTRDFLMSQYPKDWSVQPPSSELFQQGLQAYNEGSAKEGFQNNPPPSTSNTYNAINGSNMVPPDKDVQEQREQEILNTYTPKDPQSLTTYSAEDAQTLIEKIYTAKGLKATYKQTGDNQFQILSTTPLDKVITYEDDPAEPSLAPASHEAVASAGEETIIVPDIRTTGGLDPFYTPGEQTRDGRWDYTKFTPGLERMFAPTEQMQKWY